MNELTIIGYAPLYQPYFERFNRDWIEKYFWMEPIDFDVLSKPEVHILGKGGYIFMAQYNDEIAGTVALKFVDTGVYELTKMAVDEKFQGIKIGTKLAEVAIEKAKEMKASKIILYSNTKLTSAIALYRKLGFMEIPVDGTYERSNIKMELTLT